MERKILLINTDKFYIEFLKDRLNTEHFVIEVAETVDEAYEKIFTFIPDLIISSDVLDTVDGYQFCELLKSNDVLKRVPYMIIAKHMGSLHKFWAKKNDVQVVLSQETPFEEIRLAMGELLNEYIVDEDTKTEIAAMERNPKSVLNQVFDVMRMSLIKLSVINEFRDMVNEYYTNEKILVQKTFELFSEFFDYNLAGIFFNHAQESGKYILQLDIKNCTISNFVIEKVKRDFFAKMPNMKKFSITSFGHQVINEQDVDIWADRISSVDDFQEVTILPFEYEDKLIGGICMYSKNQQERMAFDIYDLLLKETTFLFKMNYLFSGIEFLSVTDGLTGLSNRRQFDYSIKREFLKSRKYPSDLSFAIMDIDHFKRFNDTYGHQYGDYVLKEVSSIIKNSFRKSDMIYRYGGEEIAIIMPETTVTTAMTILERLRRKIETYEFEFNDIQTNVTISIGIGSNLDKFDDVHQVIESADKALYKAKDTGRNRVITYSDEELD